MSETYWAIIVGEVKGPFTGQDLLVLEGTGEIYENSILRSTEIDEWVKWPDLKPTLVLPVRIVGEANADDLTPHARIMAHAPQPKAFPRAPAALARSVAQAEEQPRLNRGVYIFLAVFLGSVGVHNFYAGHSIEGGWQAALTVAGVVCFMSGWMLGVPIFAVVVFLWVVLDIATRTRDGLDRYML